MKYIDKFLTAVGIIVILLSVSGFFFITSFLASLSILDFFGGIAIGFVLVFKWEDIIREFLNKKFLGK